MSLNQSGISERSKKIKKVCFFQSKQCFASYKKYIQVLFLALSVLFIIIIAYKLLLVKKQKCLDSKESRKWWLAFWVSFEMVVALYFWNVLDSLFCGYAWSTGFATILFGAIPAYLIWHWRDENKREDQCKVERELVIKEDNNNWSNFITYIKMIQGKDNETDAEKAVAVAALEPYYKNELSKFPHLIHDFWGNYSLQYGATCEQEKLLAIPSHIRSIRNIIRKNYYCPVGEFALSNFYLPNIKFKAPKDNLDFFKEGIFIMAKMPNACFNDLILIDSVFTEAILNGSRFCFTVMTGAKMNEAIMHKVNFYRAKLSNASFVAADCTEANFASANLSGANITLTKFEKANFIGANLSDTEVYINSSILNGAYYLHITESERDILKNDKSYTPSHVHGISRLLNSNNTIFPNSFDPQKSEMINVWEYFKEHDNLPPSINEWYCNIWGIVEDTINN